MSVGAFGNARPLSYASSGDSASKALAVLRHYGSQLHDHSRARTAGPEAVEQNPEGSVQIRRGSGPSAALDKLQLMTEGMTLSYQAARLRNLTRNPWRRDRRVMCMCPALRPTTVNGRGFCGGWNLWEPQVPSCSQSIMWPCEY